jgi:hypothetical protein
MSIYATLWAVRFPSFGQFYIGCGWVTIIAQGVPAHVGAEAPDQYALFLPPLLGSVAAGLRAVVFVADGAVKGTVRSAQEYKAPLLVLSGTEYVSLPFATLHARLCDALRGDQPRLMAELLQPDGNRRLVFEDESIMDIDRPRRPES